MSSMFSRIWERAQPKFDAMYGEKFTFIPMREVKNATPVHDNERSVIFNVVGIPVIDATDAPVGGQLPHIVEYPRFSFQQNKFPQGIRRFDRLRHTHSGRTYEVTDSKPMAQHRFLVHVSEVPE